MRKKELDREKEPPKPELNSYFKDKHLLPMDKKYLDTDENGFPITKHESTSANEFYIQGYGWLDNEAFEKARKESPNPATFGGLITKANVNYVDDSCNLTSKMQKNGIGRDKCLKRLKRAQMRGFNRFLMQNRKWQLVKTKLLKNGFFGAFQNLKI